MTTLEPSGWCAVCDNPNVRFCSRCKTIRYCSNKCQEKDWRTHKLLCADYASFDVSKRPSTEHVRAILFPVDQKKPKFIWLHCPWKADEDEGDWQDAEYEPLLGPDAFGRETTIGRNPVLKRILANKIFFSYRDTFLIDGSKRNRSIASVTATGPGQCHDWRGPTVAYGRVGLAVDPDECRDLDMTDFHHVVDFLISYGNID